MNNAKLCRSDKKRNSPVLLEHTVFCSFVTTVNTVFRISGSNSGMEIEKISFLRLRLQPMYNFLFV